MISSIVSLLSDYLINPLPIWNSNIVKVLVNNKKYELAQNYLSIKEYSTSNIWTGLEEPLGTKECISGETYLEYPSNSLNEFYHDNGLDLLLPNHYNDINIVVQLRSALRYLFVENNCGESVSQLVKMIQVLRQPAPEYDVSYSHPKIPFTIFVSVGNNVSDLDQLRLAESVLHEAMHLQLTLIEEQMPLIADNTKVYYSPWRGEMRPLRGVLHAIFVFRAIQQWYTHIHNKPYSFKILDFADWRGESINNELSMIKEFFLVAGLTPQGAALAKKLLYSDSNS